MAVRKFYRNDQPLRWQDKMRVWNASDGYCYYCSTPLDILSNFQVDHKIPRRMGGSNEIDNLVAACTECNRQKGGRTADEFNRALDGLSDGIDQKVAELRKPEVRQTLNIEAAGKILGISRAVAYELARKDELPVPVIRLGRRMVVSKRALAELLDRQLDPPD